MESDWITNYRAENIDLTTIEKFDDSEPTMLDQNKIAKASFGNLKRLILKQDLDRGKTLTNKNHMLSIYTSPMLTHDKNK